MDVKRFMKDCWPLYCLYSHVQYMPLYIEVQWLIYLIDLVVDNLFLSVFYFPTTHSFFQN